MPIILNNTRYSEPDWANSVLTGYSEDLYKTHKYATDLISDVSEGSRLDVKEEHVEEAFFFCLWILKCIDESTLSSRFINEMRDYVVREAESNKDPDVLESIAQGTGLDATRLDETFSVHFVDFIRYSKKLTGNAYRLVFQPLSGGKVEVEPRILVNLYREKFVESSFKFLASIKKTEALAALSPMEEFISSVKQEYLSRRKKEKVDLGNVDSSKFPPCINEYLKLMREGVNLPQMARFTLVSFLHKVGMNPSDIIALFRSAPDFNEKITTYQVNHITGEISGTVYSPPKCSVLLSNHICFKGEDPLCNQEWLKHPLRYYQIKKMRDMGKPQTQKTEKKVN